MNDDIDAFPLDATDHLMLMVTALVTVMILTMIMMASVWRCIPWCHWMFDTDGDGSNNADNDLDGDGASNDVDIVLTIHTYL